MIKQKINTISYADKTKPFCKHSNYLVHIIENPYSKGNSLDHVRKNLLRDLVSKHSLSDTNTLYLRAFIYRITDWSTVATEYRRVRAG